MDGAGVFLSTLLLGKVGYRILAKIYFWKVSGTSFWIGFHIAGKSLKVMCGLPRGSDCLLTIWSCARHPIAGCLSLLICTLDTRRLSQGTVVGLNKTAYISHPEDSNYCRDHFVILAPPPRLPSYLQVKTFRFYRFLWGHHLSVLLSASGVLQSCISACSLKTSIAIINMVFEYKWPASCLQTLTFLSF